MRKRTRRALLASVTSVFMVLAMMPAIAKPPSESGVVVRMPDARGFVYSGDGVHVLTGPPLAQGCLGEGFSVPTVQFVFRPNGSMSHHFSITEGLHVFDDEGIPDVFEWLDRTCGALFDGDPATVLPTPLATGEGKVTFHLRVDTSGVVHIHNGARGKVTTADGHRVHLSTFAKLTEGPGGLDLQILRVNYGG